MDVTNLTDLYNLPTLDWTADGGPARVDDTGRPITADYSAPSAGQPPWFVYRVDVSTATALATLEPGGATRWRL
jgi:hypothetical protein